MKKIGVLTHYYHNKNIGALLQAYALTSVLCRNNKSAVQISFDFNFYDSYSKKMLNNWCPKKNPLRNILKYAFIKIRFLITKILFNNKKFVQNSIFRDFEHFIPHSPEKYNTLTISKANPNYDIFIIGSDQVFASYLLPLSAYYGEFAAADKKVISYAASSDVKVFPQKAENLFKQKLKRLNKISVREKTLKDYIEKITDKKATVVLDPTFLLSPADWLKIANPAPVPTKKYIFCYFLGGKSVWQRKAARAYADKYGYELVHLPYIMQTIRPADIYLKGQGRYDVGPREFISLIHGAECIFTDSFHGLAFSINFSKQFYVFNRDDQAGPQSMNARITDTLDLFQLSHRHITSPTQSITQEAIDYSPVQKILAKRKQESIEWLLNALKD